MPEIGKIKISAGLDQEDGLESEQLWARYVGGGLAKVNNIPVMASGVSLGDTVEINADLEIVKIVEKAANTRLVRWEAVSDDENLAKMVIQYFEQNGIMAEYSRRGLVVLAVPLGMVEKRLEEVRSYCPIKIKLYEQEKS